MSSACLLAFDAFLPMFVPVCMFKQRCAQVCDDVQDVRALVACRNKVIGMILVKELALVDKHASTPLSSLKMRSLPYLRANMPLYDLLRLFETGRCHMAALTEVPEVKGGLAAFDGPMTPPHPTTPPPSTPDGLQGRQLDDLHPLVSMEMEGHIHFQDQVSASCWFWPVLPVPPFHYKPCMCLCSKAKKAC